MMKKMSKMYAAGGKTGDKLKMVKNKDGDMVPFFAADGQGKMKDGGTADMWGSLRQEFVNVEASIRQGDPAAMNKALTALGEIIEQGAEAEQVWEEMYEAIEAKTKVGEREWRRLRDLRQFMTVQQSMDLVSYLVECVTRHVTDSDVLARITVDMDKVLSGKQDN